MRRWLYLLLVTMVPAMLTGAPVSAAPVAPTSCQVFPADDIWNADISALPVHPRSAQWLASMGAGTTKLHPDFGGPPYGFPVTIVDNNHATVSVAFQYASESDPGPYPVGADTAIESGSDHHALILNRDTCTLYELFDLSGSGSSWTAGSGAIFPLGSDALRPSGWTSADAAGLPMLPGLVRWDEVQAGSINHAIRFTAQQTDTSFLWPARHQAGTASNPALPPMGARFRLKGGYDISAFSPSAQVILRALQHYGLILADNGSNWYFSGTEDASWPDALLTELKTVPASQFEAVDESSLMVDPNSGRTAAECGTAGSSTGPAPTPTPSTTFYFAEGYTGAGFTECLSLFSPHSSGTAQIDYQLRSGGQITQLVSLTAGRVGKVNVNAAVGADQEVSARVLLPGPGVVERAMYFRTRTWQGSTDLVGVNQPATEWDFAEGSTLSPYSEYLTLQNPNVTAAAITLNFFLDNGAHPVKHLNLAGKSRTTVEMASGDLGSENPCQAGAGGTCGVGPGHTGVSVQVISGAPIVAERPMYVNGYSFGAGAIRDGHDAFGANRAGLRWDFAEGTTLGGFDEFLTVANPGTLAAHVSLGFMDGSGVITTRMLVVGGTTRSTVLVNDPSSGIGPGVTGVSVEVTSDQPIVAERPMYMVHDFGTGVVAGAHDVMGIVALGQSFGFAQASTLAGENDYLTIENPTGATATLTITYYPGGAPVTRTVVVAPTTRKTVLIFQASEGVGAGIAAVGVVVTSDQPVLVEKPTYSSNFNRYGATDTAGFAGTGL